MQLFRHLNLPKLLLLLPFFGAYSSFSQCSPQMGPAPSNSFFATGPISSDGTSGNPIDQNWTVATDSINGVYNSTFVMVPSPAGYYQALGSQWISTSPSGNQSQNHNYFFKIDFNLPCSNPCGNNFNNPGAFCLSLDLFADNSIYEIYVNGVPQSPNLGGIIPAYPLYNGNGEFSNGITTVSLCNNWKGGPNTLIIEVTTSPPVVGLLVQPSSTIPQNISNFLVANICQGQSYPVGNQSFSKSGYFLDTISQTPGCDSVVELNLTVKPASFTTINQSICQGQSFLGYSANGIYLDTFPAVNGCDSIRTINLTVQANPNPDLGNITDFCTGDSLILSPGQFSSYIWQDGSTGNQFVVKNPGTYSVTVSNACSSASKSITIASKNCFINFPNAFTPNGDGKNDLFMVLTQFQLQDYDLSVFNRWGQKVFETRDQRQGWDGTFNGMLQDSGGYVWYCSFKNSTNTSYMKGTVILVR